MPAWKTLFPVACYILVTCCVTSCEARQLPEGFPSLEREIAWQTRDLSPHVARALLWPHSGSFVPGGGSDGGRSAGGARPPAEREDQRPCTLHMASGKMEAQNPMKLARGPQWYLCAGTPPGGGLAGWPAAAYSWTWYWPSWLQTLNGPPQSSGPLHPVAGPGTHRLVARSLAGPGVGRGAVSGVGTTLFGLEWFLTLCLSFSISQPTCWASLFSRVLQEVGECRLIEISSAVYRERCCVCEANAVCVCVGLLCSSPPPPCTPHAQPLVPA